MCNGIKPSFLGKRWRSGVQTIYSPKLVESCFHIYETYLQVSLKNTSASESLKQKGVKWHLSMFLYQMSGSYYTCLKIPCLTIIIFFFRWFCLAHTLLEKVLACKKRCTMTLNQDTCTFKMTWPHHRPLCKVSLNSKSKF